MDDDFLQVSYVLYFLWVIFMGNKKADTSRREKGDKMPTVENVYFETTTRLNALEKYVEDFKKLPQKDAQEIAKKNLINTGIIDEQGNLIGFYKNT